MGVPLSCLSGKPIFRICWELSVLLRVHVAELIYTLVSSSVWAHILSFTLLRHRGNYVSSVHCIRRISSSQCYSDGELDQGPIHMPISDVSLPAPVLLVAQIFGGGGTIQISASQAHTALPVCLGHVTWEYWVSSRSSRQGCLLSSRTSLGDVNRVEFSASGISCWYSLSPGLPREASVTHVRVTCAGDLRATQA
jgi:hypothetical protein